MTKTEIEPDPFLLKVFPHLPTALFGSIRSPSTISHVFCDLGQCYNKSAHVLDGQMKFTAEPFLVTSHKIISKTYK